MTANGASGPIGALDWARLVVLGLLWGGSFFFARIAVGEVHPLALVLLRVSIAALALHVWLVASGVDFRRALPFAGPLALLGLVNNAIPFSLIFLGQTELGAGLASVLNATTPFWTILFARAFATGEPLGWNRVAGVLLGVAGVAVLVGPGLADRLGGPVWPMLALIGASMAYAFALILVRKLGQLPPAILATGQLTASTLIMAPLVLLVVGWGGLHGFSQGVWLAVAGLALLSTALAYLIYFAIVASAGVTNASLVTLLVPVSAILLGALFLGERLELREFAGRALIGAGLLTIDGRIALRR